MKFISFILAAFCVLFFSRIHANRNDLHDAIVSSFVEEMNSHPNQINHLVILMGGAAHGKSTLLNTIIPEKTGMKACFSTDKIREKIPEYQEGIRNRNPEIASQVHEECLVLNKRIVQELFNNQCSFIYESTGADLDYTRWLLTLADQGNYTVSVFFADADLDVALERAKQREKITGRAVPPAVIEKSHHLAKSNFISLLPELKEWMVIENSGDSPKIVWEKKCNEHPICFDSSYFLPITPVIFHIDTLSMIEHYVTDDCWIVTDLDDTLITAEESAGRDIGRSYLAKQIRNADPFTSERWSSALSPLLDHIHKHLVEETSADLIKKWQEKGIPVIGLTARPFEGKGLENLIEKTVHQMNSLSLSFSANVPFSKEKTTFPSGAAFYQGIIFSGPRPKGKTLEEFLSLCPYLPRRILFIDNKLRHVQSVIDNSKSVEIIPFYYTRVKETDRQIAERLAHLQLAVFADQGVLLSDDAAKQLLQQN
jgi:predicted ABC-type ATPase